MSTLELADLISSLLVTILKEIIRFFFTNFVLRKDGTINRRMMRISEVPAESHIVKGVKAVDITIDRSTGVWCRVFVPSQRTKDSGTGDKKYAKMEEKLPVIIFYHGGGFALSEPSSREYDLLCRSLAKSCPAVVISCSYRLAPEHKHPVQYEDAYSGLEWLKSQSVEAHEDFPVDMVDFSRVFVAGDSAGGNIAHRVAVKAGVSDVSPISVAGLVLLQPFFGGESRTASEVRFAKGQMLELTQTDFMWRAFLPAGSDRDHPSANVCGPNAPSFQAMNLPRILLLVGGLDLLQDRQIEYAEAMRSAGKDVGVVVFEKGFHAFYIFGNLTKEWRLLLQEISEFVSGNHQSMSSKRIPPS